MSSICDSDDTISINLTVLHFGNKLIETHCPTCAEQFVLR